MKKPILISHRHFTDRRTEPSIRLNKIIAKNILSLNNRYINSSKEKPKIVGQIAICKHEMWELAVKELLRHVDEIYIRFDIVNGNTDILSKLPSVCGNKLKGLLESKTKWDKFTWREELIRMLDKVAPDIVLSIDEDEVFEDCIDSEILDFYKSSKNGMMFNYFSPMPTEDDSIILDGKPYPLHMHMKAFRWMPNLTYRRYTGNAKITNYCGSDNWYIAKTKIKHYSFYKKEWYQQKEEWIKKFWGKDYFSTYYKKCNALN